MSCKISININGVEVEIGTSDKPITDITQLENLLKNSDLKDLTEILSQMKKINSISEVDLMDINENSLGTQTPRDIFKSITVKSIKDVISGLSIPEQELKKYSVITGFADPSIRTQYRNGHIFLNLNYLNDNYNKAVSLIELALFLKDPNNYDVNTEVLASGNNSDLLNELVPDSSNKNEIIKGIKFIYDEVNRKRSDSLTNYDLLNKRESFLDIWDKFGNVSTQEQRDYNYSAAQFLPAKDIRQGDLVSIPYGNDKTVYQVFFDYKIDEGNVVITTISEINGVPKTHRFSYKDGQEILRVKRYNPTEIILPQVSKDTMRFKVTDKLFYWNFESLTDYLRLHGASIPMTNGSNKALKIQGNTVFLENGKEITVDKIKSIDVPVSAIPSATKPITKEQINKDF